jgi:four helix bundle protein
MNLRVIESVAQSSGQQEGARHRKGGSLPGRSVVEGGELSGQPTFGFEKLAAWQEAIAYAKFVYTLTSRFPDAERFGLTSQLRRSAVSISANLAEGSARFTGKDFARFVEIAYGSLMENISEATVARQEGFLSIPQVADLRGRADKLARMLSGLRSSILREQP